MPQRRFPSPWSVEETDACFIVRDHNGQALAYVSLPTAGKGRAKRLGSPYRSGRAGCWAKVKNPAAPAITREAEEEWELGLPGC
jgi:hypothetical protein